MSGELKSYSLLKDIQKKYNLNPVVKCLLEILRTDIFLSLSIVHIIK